MPWLGRGHLGALCQTLAAAGIDPTRWDDSGILWAIDDRNRALGWDAPIPETQHRRLRLLAHQLRQIVISHTDRPTPTEQRVQAALAAQQRIAQQQADDTDSVQKVTPAEDDDLREELDRIKAEAAELAKADQERKDAERAQGEAAKAERAERAKAEREAAGAGPVVAPSQGGESQAAKIVRQGLRRKRFGLEK